MSKLKLSPNLFLEVNELNKLVNFLENDGYKLIIKQLIKEYGITQNADNTMFKVSHKSGTDNVVIINPGIAIDHNVNVINLEQNTEITIPYSTDKQWLAVSYATTNNEVGVVDVSPQGNLSGHNTKFLSVLRGQPNFPTKVKFSSSNNKEEYEVVDVKSDTEATIVGSFIEEKNLKYQVIGTFTPGFQPNDEDKMIYEYDSCLIHVINSIEKPEVDENTFIIACVDFENGINVIDGRTDYLNNKIDNVIGSENIINNNPFVSLIRTKLFNEKLLDLQFEWGYKIDKFELITTSVNNIVKVINGNSHYIPNVQIPNNIFKGWKLLNRKNMMSVDIDYNESNYLYISVFSSSIITGEGDDFIIIPNFKDIEVEVKLSGDNYEEDSPNHYFRFSILNRKSRFIIPVEYKNTFIELKYRMIGEDKTTLFQNFAVTQFENINKEKETLGDSSFSIFINEPEEVKRNYS